MSEWRMFRLALLSISACGPGEGVETRHPTRENLEPPGIGLLQISRRDTIVHGGETRVTRPEAGDHFLAIVSGLRNLPVPLHIGNLAEDDSAFFGEVGDVAIAPGGATVLALDSRLNTVKEFDTTGRFLTSFSRAGSGPGELRQPVAMDVSPDGTIVIADRSRQVKSFRKGERGYEEVGATPTNFVAEDVCWAGSAFVARGWTVEGHLLHRGDGAGKEWQSFGEEYVSNNALVREQLSDGLVACGPRGDWLADAFLFLPILRVRVRGRDASFAIRLQDFVPMSILESVTSNGKPSVRFSRRERFNVVTGVFPVDDDLVGIQVARVPARGDTLVARQPAFDTYIISVAARTGVYVGETPYQISAVRLPWVAGLSNEPFPQVLLARMGSGARGGTGPSGWFQTVTRDSRR